MLWVEVVPDVMGCCAGLDLVDPGFPSILVSQDDCYFARSSGCHCVWLCFGRGSETLNCEIQRVLDDV